MNPIQVVDSHTGGEPTRVVVAGGPDLGRGPIAERLERFKRDHDGFRSTVVNEPRGSDVVVGALLCEPVDPTCAAGVIFFNNVGTLGMCGHGTIGLIATLAHLGRIRPGAHRLETPVGVVTATLHGDGQVSVENVPSYRTKKAIAINGITGDIAWGGNWFFLVEHHGQRLERDNVEALTDYAWRLRQAVNSEHPEIDHIELFGPSPVAHSRNFVLCPGGTYDRSPCGTGTSAKAACLYSDGKLRADQVWRQESILGSAFEVSVRVRDGMIIPTIQGRAYVTGEATLIFDARDPFVSGIR